MSKVFLTDILGKIGNAEKRETTRPARAPSATGRQPPPMDGFVNIGPALICSPMMRFFGRPYPVQFRAQGALNAWTRALGNTGLWPLWQDPGTLCWQIRQEILGQLESTYPRSSVAGQISAEDRQRLAFQVSTNLKYHLSEGTVIEATPALETLLANSDVDLSLPMSMVAALPGPHSAGTPLVRRNLLTSLRRTAIIPTVNTQRTRTGKNGTNGKRHKTDDERFCPSRLCVR